MRDIVINHFCSQRTKVCLSLAANIILFYLYFRRKSDKIVHDVGLHKNAQFEKNTWLIY